jgi:hypothetical protein
LKGLYPQTEIRSTDPEGAWLEFETASEQRALNRRDKSLIHWWNSKLEFLIPLCHRSPVLAFQLREQRKIGFLLLFRQAQFMPRKVVAVDYFSLDRSLDIGKRVFRISVAGESQCVFQEPHLSGKR